MAEQTSSQTGTPVGPAAATSALAAVASGPRAGFWQRVGAYLVDFVPLGILNLILSRAIGTAGWLLVLVLTIAYFAYFEGGVTGQTLGKRVFGIRVIDFPSGRPIGFGRGVVRYLGKLLASIPFGIGFLWMLWDDEKQNWDDKIARTVVVPVSAYPVPQST